MVHTVSIQTMIVLELATTDLHKYLRGIRLRYITLVAIYIVSCNSALQPAVHRAPTQRTSAIQS